MKKITIGQAWGFGGLMAVSAVRYCLGRQCQILNAELNKMRLERKAAHEAMEKAKQCAKK